MKRTVSFTSVIALTLLFSFAFLPFVFAQTDLDAFLGNTITDSQIDGVIGSEWDDAGHYENIPINPTGTAEVWIKHDETDLFIAYQFAADSNNPWTGIQFQQSGCMTPTADGALFGNDEHEPNGYLDIYFGGVGVITVDAVQNGEGAINIDSSNIVTVELKKPLNSADSAGNDIDWSTGDTGVIVIMWDSNGHGSSGGSANHMGSNIIPKDVFLNSEPIPEFSTIIVIIFIITTTVSLVFLRKKSKR